MLRAQVLECNHEQPLNNLINHGLHEECVLVKESLCALKSSLTDDEFI